jgi:hypothetical protein
MQQVPDLDEGEQATAALLRRRVEQLEGAWGMAHAAAEAAQAKAQRARDALRAFEPLPAPQLARVGTTAAGLAANAAALRGSLRVHGFDAPRRASP